MAAVSSSVKNGISVPFVSGCCHFFVKNGISVPAVSSSVKSGISVPVVGGCCQFFCQEWYKCSCCGWLLSVLLSRVV